MPPRRRTENLRVILDRPADVPGRILVIAGGVVAAADCGMASRASVLSKSSGRIVMIERRPS